jgi:hypothetical protein
MILEENSSLPLDTKATKSKEVKEAAKSKEVKVLRQSKESKETMEEMSV